MRRPDKFSIALCFAIWQDGVITACYMLSFILRSKLPCTSLSSRVLRLYFWKLCRKPSFTRHNDKENIIFFDFSLKKTDCLAAILYKFTEPNPHFSLSKVKILPLPVIQISLNSLRIQDIFPVIIQSQLQICRKFTNFSPKYQKFA